MVGADFVALSPEALWVGFWVIGLISIPMGMWLMGTLGPHPRRNLYTILFYLRAAIYFLLLIICIVWYSSQLGALAIAARTSR
jgi:hypothetical protein